MDDCSDVYNSDEWNQQSDNYDELGRDLNKSLKFDNFDGKKKSIYYYDEEEEDGGDITESLLVQMGYSKTESKNRPAMPQAPGEEEVEEEEYGDIITEESLNQMCRRKTQPRPTHKTPATPIPAENLKSAMKGSSREEKSPGKERKVTWADDVFDSIPSHFTTLRVEAHSHSHKSRQKWGKEKNKSGGTGKDKKRKGGAKGKKFSSGSKKCFDTPLDEEDGT